MTYTEDVLVEQPAIALLDTLVGMNYLVLKLIVI